jgi:hypothetical protein
MNTESSGPRFTDFAGTSRDFPLKSGTLHDAPGTMMVMVNALRDDNLIQHKVTEIRADNDVRVRE